jgi:hypothetical protein
VPLVSLLLGLAAEFAALPAGLPLGLSDERWFGALRDVGDVDGAAMGLTRSRGW